ncbi:MAG TPA: hypothetical protein VK208_17880 [Pyrinomonadaceae bacterium]|jgi:hypothetical protein|nr:hypothetical protein [Pyrinomonadaceae bacterium]
MLGPERIGEIESAVATWTETEISEPYVRGDLFCLNDHVFFLIFDDKAKVPGTRAGIVYEASTPEPFRKLDSFCRTVRELLLAHSGGQGSGTAEDFPEWTHGKPNIPEGFKRFVARQDTDSLYTSLRKDTMSRRILAASRLEDESARVFLRGAREAHQEGYAAKLLTENTAEARDFSIERLEDVGLVEREVQVSCRKTGHALFRLPNPHALAVVTVSDATCSECGSPVADEKVEEVFAPTRLASSLLEDGSWLLSRLHFLLREMGVPESEIAVGPSEGEGHGQMMANICGEPFLTVARDGDLTPAFARWAIDLEIETEASHLVVVATGRMHNQAQVLLLNHSRSRILGGRDFELVLADGPASAGRELRYAFERVSQRVVAEQLCDLDSSMGLNVSRVIIAKFNLLRNAEAVGPRNLASPPEPSWSHPAPPLTLAAHASANSAEVPYLGEFPVNDVTADNTDESGESVEIQLNQEAQGSWD